MSEQTQRAGELIARCREMNADIQAARAIPAAEFPGERNMYMMNLDGVLSAATPELCDLLEQAIARLVAAERDRDALLAAAAEHVGDDGWIFAYGLLDVVQMTGGEFQSRLSALRNAYVEATAARARDRSES